jgi:hypothetical protein
MQDGADFYDLRTKDLIASYPTLCKGIDLPGAQAAEAQFLRDHPHYRMATERDLFE